MKRLTHSGNVIPALVGFLACTSIVLAVALGWEIKQRQSLELDHENLWREYSADKAKWQEIQSLAYSALKSGQDADDTRKSFDEKLSNASGELEAKITSLSRDFLAYKLDQKKKQAEPVP